MSSHAHNIETLDTFPSLARNLDPALTGHAIPGNRSTPHGLRVVCFGGGTGLSTLLAGLKRFVVLPGERPQHGGLPFGFPFIERLTAVVAVSDNGGSSGRLRDEFQVLPPGDIRNCLVALADDGLAHDALAGSGQKPGQAAGERGEALLARMFRFRFEKGNGLQGHSFGNLFLTVLAELTNDFAEAVNLACALLKTRGRVLPATSRSVELAAELDDGTVLTGETTIAAAPRPIRRLHLLPADVPALPQTLAEIAAADLIVVGPGSLYTSVIPNLLVREIPQAIVASTALKAYVCNLMTQPNETLGMSASAHLRAIYEHTGRPIFDCALVNRAVVPAEILSKYAAEGAEQVRCDREQLNHAGLRVVEGDYLGFAKPDSSLGSCTKPGHDVLRHAADAVVRDLLPLAREHAAAMAVVSGD
jgi:uncharacterized cofD-like protein